MSDAVRKAVLSINSVWVDNSVRTFPLFFDPEAFPEMDAAIYRALAACDEACVWEKDGGMVLKTNCGRYWQTLEDGDRVDFPYCPFCGRKIKEADDA